MKWLSIMLLMGKQAKSIRGDHLQSYSTFLWIYEQMSMETTQWWPERYILIQMYVEREDHIAIH